MHIKKTCIIFAVQNETDMRLLEFFILLVAMFATAIFFNSRFATAISLIVFKTEEDIQATKVSLITLSVAVVAWAIYITWF